MILEIVTPEATLFKGNVDAVAVPGVNGEFQILENHAPIVSLLTEGKVKIKGQLAIKDEFKAKFSTENDATVLAINSGTLEMNDNKVIVLAD